jgi:hypothetical protein
MINFRAGAEIGFSVRSRRESDQKNIEKSAKNGKARF